MPRWQPCRPALPRATGAKFGQYTNPKHLAQLRSKQKKITKCLYWRHLLSTRNPLRNRHCSRKYRCFWHRCQDLLPWRSFVCPQPNSDCNSNNCSSTSNNNNNSKRKGSSSALYWIAETHTIGMCPLPRKPNIIRHLCTCYPWCCHRRCRSQHWTNSWCERFSLICDSF